MMVKLGRQNDSGLKGRSKSSFLQLPIYYSKHHDYRIQTWVKRG
jgi:hypothetical protein